LRLLGLRAAGQHAFDPKRTPRDDLAKAA
jgi:hypothetical protein